MFLFVIKPNKETKKKLLYGKETIHFLICSRYIPVLRSVILNGFSVTVNRS